MDADESTEIESDFSDRLIVGLLSYASTGTRPDIAVTVGIVNRFLAIPKWFGKFGNTDDNYRTSVSITEEHEILFCYDTAMPLGQITRITRGWLVSSILVKQEEASNSFVFNIARICHSNLSSSKGCLDQEWTSQVGIQSRRRHHLRR